MSLKIDTPLRRAAELIDRHFPFLGPDRHLGPDRRGGGRKSSSVQVEFDRLRLTLMCNGTGSVSAPAGSPLGPPAAPDPRRGAGAVLLDALKNAVPDAGDPVNHVAVNPGHDAFREPWKGELYDLARRVPEADVA